MSLLVWQHIPETLDPIAFTIGFFSVYWYALFFLGGFFAALFLAFRFASRGGFPYSQEVIFDMFLYIFFGALLGGHIGYALFYNLDAFIAMPHTAFLPYDFGRGLWVGISGMSYHGGLIGAALALYWFARRQKIDFWKAADFAVFFAPIAIFFGRLGNFFNVELHGRITEQPWGMIFPGVLPDGVLRHPSTLYEAFLEGVVLFALLILLRKKMPFSGALTCAFLAGYAILRFLGEYFREPDTQIGFLFGPPAGGFTMGQILSVILFFASIALFAWLKHKNRATI
ncbi:MAG: prolipoprotein diacylglyceryl transferase [Patescibacteria group bacterium]